METSMPMICTKLPHSILCPLEESLRGGDGSKASQPERAQDFLNGNLIVNFEPLPGSLSTEMAPRCSWMSHGENL